RWSPTPVVRRIGSYCMHSDQAVDRIQNRVAANLRKGEDDGVRSTTAPVRRSHAPAPCRNRSERKPRMRLFTIHACRDRAPRFAAPEECSTRSRITRLKLRGWASLTSRSLRPVSNNQVHAPERGSHGRPVPSSPPAGGAPPVKAVEPWVTLCDAKW